jgi:hypothetical protein
LVWEVAGQTASFFEYGAIRIKSEQSLYRVSEFKYPGTVVDELVRSRKRCSDPVESVLKVLAVGTFRRVLETESDVPVVMDWIINAGRLNDTSTFRSALLINNISVRGIDFHPLSRRRYYKEDIPSGWHQDLISPREPEHRRVEFEMGHLTEIHDFVLRVAAEWNIEIEREEALL